MAGAGDAFREGLQLGPLGLPIRVTKKDPTGEGDRSSLLGDTVYVPSGDVASIPHEGMHANVRQLETMIPGGMLAEALASRAAESAYGGQTQYLNPFERLAYGYQEGVTGQPDEGYQRALAAPSTGSVLRRILNIGGAGADLAGRTLGKLRR